MQQLADTLKSNSSLNFTIERSIGSKIPYFDVEVMQKENEYATKVYTKPTNVGRCLNGKSECSESYKKSDVAAYVKRALTQR